tara:strand:- start:406 stop:549 length:144 start_codon:yes stop_codon:yes gene_type:complete
MKMNGLTSIIILKGGGEIIIERSKDMVDYLSWLSEEEAIRRYLRDKE